MSLSVGELAERLRVTARTLRHYHDVGLLVPDHVEANTGYRRYGADQLMRAVHIEQLKAAGLSLADIAAVLGSPDDRADRAMDVLHRRREQIEIEMADRQRQLAAIDAMMTAPVELGAASVVVVPAGYAVVCRTRARADDLGPSIRRAIQQVGRRVRQRDGVRCRSFSARFPVAVGDDGVDVDVDVAGLVDVPTSTSTLQPAETRFQLTFVGPFGLLPVAYDAALTSAREQRLALGGSVVEHYLDIGPVGRIELGFALDPLTAP